MATTPAQSAANRRNAARSTGPKTEAGKWRSRMNALDHGLRAEQVVLPTEDPAAFAAELAGWQDDWRPASRTRAALVERAAVGAWRLRRCVRQEAATLQSAAWSAGRQFDEHVASVVAEGLALLATDPPAGLGHLRGSAAGLGALLDLWGEVLIDVEDPTRWTEPDLHHGRLRSLLGLHEDVPSSEGGPAVRASYRLVLHNDRVPGADTAQHLTAEAAEAEADAIRFVARAQLSALRAELACREPLAATRSRHVELKACEPTERGRSLHRYEMAHDRAFRATLNQLMAMAKSGIDEAGAAVDDESETIDPIPAPAVEGPSPPSGPPAPNEPIGPKSRTFEDLQAARPAEEVEPPSSPGGPTRSRPDFPSGSPGRAPSVPIANVSPS